MKINHAGEKPEKPTESFKEELEDVGFTNCFQNILRCDD